MQDQGAALTAFAARVATAVAEARTVGLDAHADALAAALGRMVEVTRGLAKRLQQDPTRGLANASVYLDLASRVVYAWLWLRQATIAARALAAGASGDEARFYQAKVAAARFYFGFELPKNAPDADLLARNDAAALEFDPEWF